MRLIHKWDEFLDFNNLNIHTFKYKTQYLHGNKRTNQSFCNLLDGFMGFYKKWHHREMSMSEQLQLQSSMKIAC